MQTYDIPKAQQLLESLLGEAHLMLLFLKTLSAIEVGDWLGQVCRTKDNGGLEGEER